MAAGNLIRARDYRNRRKHDSGTLHQEKNQLKPTEIRFYRASEKPYGAFSNLYKRPVLFEERIFRTAEHAYQAGKPRRDEVREWLLSAPSPALLAMAAHGLYTWEIVPDWSHLKFERMRRVLWAKFTQHKDLAELLLSTGNARLVEAGTKDDIVNRTWGEVNGKGANMLGVLLMEVRELLRKAAQSAALKPGEQPRTLKATAQASQKGRKK